MTDAPRRVVYVDHFIANNSSVIREAFLAHNGDVYVVFNTGRVAGYLGVGQWVFKAFSNAKSAGQYYNAYIKDSFAGLNGNVTFVQYGATVTPVAAPQRVATAVVDNSYDVVFDLDGKEVVFPVKAKDDEVALQAGLAHVAAFAGLHFKPVKVVRNLV